MRVAIATEGTEVAQHFGRCASYTLVEIEGEEVVDYTVVPNPGHQPGFLPGYLAQQGVKCVIAGGMGPRAMNLFADYGIETVVGVTGPVTEVAEQFARGELQGGESWCEHGQRKGGGP
ncbi:MAG TPA: dinitrogenase iron-molybdenum cofactor [Armatimonadetes bacterium]|nr:dinitrogenase iron-molybdenum cofactor [Armatimonadota bacterium]